MADRFDVDAPMRPAVAMPPRCPRDAPRGRPALRLTVTVGPGTGDALVVVTPGTVATLPGLPSWWSGHTLRATMEAGEVRGVIGPRFAGRRLVVELPLASVEVTGTTFAVLGNDEGSCVCVLDGHVTMADRALAPVVVPPGRRRVVPRSGGSPIEEAIRPMERMKLEMLRDQTRAALR